MDCKDAKKRIQEYIDGDAEYAQISAHIETCAECRAYYQSMMRQKELLASLAPKTAPAFDLVAAKRRKRAKINRTLSWASAAAAVLVVVLLAGSMTGLFAGAKSEAPMAAAEEAPAAKAIAEGGITEDQIIYEGAYVPDDAAFEEAAPAEKEEAAAPPEKEEAPAEEAEAEAPEEEWSLAAGVMYDISQNDFDALLAELSAAGYHPEMTEATFVINITKENADELNEIFSPYADKYLDPGITVYFSAE